VAAATAAAFAADVVFVVASRGILLGPWPEDLTGDAGVEAPVPVLRITAAPAVDLVTRVGRCSEEVTPLEVVALDGFSLVRGATPSAGSISSVSSSSESESCATRLATGVFRGWPGGAMAFAAAAAFAMWRLGVTGGSMERTWPGAVGVVCMASTSSFVSAGGVAGVTSAADAIESVVWAFRISSTAAHLAHSSCFKYMYCCCGPTTLPGRTMRMNAMASFPVKPYFQIRYAPMSVPVLPRPALHYQKVINE
jgi:hypothetical protein